MVPKVHKWARAKRDLIYRRAQRECPYRRTGRRTGAVTRETGAAHGLARPSLPDHLRDLARGRIRVAFVHQLGEDIFQRGQSHQIAQMVDRVVGHRAALMQNHHPVTDFLHHFQPCELNSTVLPEAARDRIRLRSTSPT